MKILDGHIHIEEGQTEQSDFLHKLKLAGIDGGIVISMAPPSFVKIAGPHAAAARLDGLFECVKNAPKLFPFYWIDPLEANAAEQVELAVERGVDGFKVICNRFFPGDPRAMAIFRQIAHHRKPILFHSGILWDGQDSSRYNRPAEFEALFEIDNLKFALAHISWPWCDELIAVYGKFQNAHSRDDQPSVELFIDLTPGTPAIYRKDALTKLFTVGYDVHRNIIFGTDCMTNDYNHAWAREWIERDNSIYRELGLDGSIIAGIYSQNLMRFLGRSSKKPELQRLRAANC